MNNDLRLHVFKRDNYICYICGRETLHGKKRNGLPLATVDHFIPRSRGGTDDLSNLKTCCADCNSKKGGKIYKTKKEYEL